MKPTGWMSNSPHILQQLRKRCTGPRGTCSYTGTPHRHATGKVARDAAIYPFLLCKAILVGFCKQLREDGHLTAGSCGFTSWNETLDNLTEAHVNRENKHILAISEEAEEESDEERTDVPHGEAKVCYAVPSSAKPIKDAMSGQLLDSGLVAIARQKELKYFLAKNVWLKRARSEAYRVTGKRPISVKWVDVSKGGGMNPRCRSRLVACQVEAHDKPGASSFAPTPPLEALRTVLPLVDTIVGAWRPCYVRSLSAGRKSV